MTTATLNTRLKKLQASGDGMSLDHWAAVGAKNICEVPRHGLVSIVVGRLIPRHLAGGVFDHPLCVAWREGLDFDRVVFSDWLTERGTSVDELLEEVQRTWGAQ
jgi:hypothetical protein